MEGIAPVEAARDRPSELLPFVDPHGQGRQAGRRFSARRAVRDEISVEQLPLLVTDVQVGFEVPAPGPAGEAAGLDGDVAGVDRRGVLEPP